LEPGPVHSVEDIAVLVTEVASVQPTRELVLNTNEVQLTDGVEPVVETVDAPTRMIKDQVPEEVARDHTDTERETVPVTPSSSPVSTMATTVIARQTPASLTVRSMREEIAWGFSDATTSFGD
jgi:hypothetical protein